ncbi:MAG: bifunctional folylpolyglutamate synthase/dihydrofolate synthase [Arcticibacter sp.]
MDYRQTVEYLYSRLPMFSKQGASAIKKDLDNTLVLCAALGNPQHRFKAVHVAGTNGKGSSSHMLASILQEAGYKTGLYTSPHLRDFRERIRINGEMITEEQVVSFVSAQRSLIEEVNPSFFEVTVAMAFDYFANEKVDIAVIETGLGGRLDSTNVIKPLVSVITNIGYDHMAILGTTLPEIAAEKAGIIKPEVPVVIGEASEEVKEVFLEKAAREHSPIYFASEEWKADRREASNDQLLHLRAEKTTAGTSDANAAIDLSLDLTGSYQLKNVKTVLSTVEQLRLSGFVISDEQVYAGLQQVTSRTGLMGRWQTISHHPLTICDTGHNEDGIREVLKNLAGISYRQLHLVIGMVKDKDISKVLSMLPKEAIYYFCAPDIERAKPASELKKEAFAAGLSGEAYPSVTAALLEAQACAKDADLVFVGGSTFVVAEVV